MPTIVSNSLARMEDKLRESERIHLLKNLVWAKDQKAYDDVVRLAHTICGTPIALITMVGAREQWIQSKFGLTINSTSREVSFCQHTICMTKDEYLLVEDTLLSSKFCLNPLVTGPPFIRFYLGFPIISPEGVNVGALCVIDTQPRTMTEEQRDALRALRDHVSTYLSTPIPTHEKAWLWLRGLWELLKSKLRK